MSPLQAVDSGVVTYEGCIFPIPAGTRALPRFEWNPRSDTFDLGKCVADTHLLLHPLFPRREIDRMWELS